LLPGLFAQRMYQFNLILCQDFNKRIKVIAFKIQFKIIAPLNNLSVINQPAEMGVEVNGKTTLKRYISPKVVFYLLVEY
jgi:hypothetical protein